MTPKMKNNNENEKEITTFFGQISKSIVQIFKTIEAAIFTFPKFMFWFTTKNKWSSNRLLTIIFKTNTAFWNI